MVAFQLRQNISSDPITRDGFPPFSGCTAPLPLNYIASPLSLVSRSPLVSTAISPTVVSDFILTCTLPRLPPSKMNFFKQAQEFAESANVDGDENNKKAGGESGGIGNLMGEAQSMFNKAQSEGDDGPAAARTHEELPGGRRPPSNAELMESSKMLYGAAQGQKVSNQQLAGAAEDLLGGLVSHGKLDQGQYSTYINQAEQYLHKYSGEGDAERSAPPASRAEEDDARAPARRTPAEQESEEAEPARAPARRAPAEQESEEAEPARARAPAQESADEGEGISLPGKVPSWMNDRA